jgi:hypothetical protein
MSILKDLRLFFSYKSSIRKNKVRLQGDFNMRIDNADRMYTVLNIPTNLVEEPYNLRKEDIDKIAQNYIRDYINELSTFLNSIGISELYDFYEPIKKVDKYSYLIVIGYKQLDSVEINKILYRVILPIISIVGLISFTFWLWKV